MGRGQLELLLEDERWNALVAWPILGAVGIVAAGELVAGDQLWALFATVVLFLAIVPPVVFRSPRLLLPWEVLLLAALPVAGVALGTSTLTGNVAVYLAVAALALIVAVELHTFTPVRMTTGFAIVFVVVTTLASAGIWALLRWAIDLTTGSALITDHDVMMWEFVYAAIAGVAAGIVFELYFRRYLTPSDRVPADLSDAIGADLTAVGSSTGEVFER